MEGRKEGSLDSLFLNLYVYFESIVSTKTGLNKSTTLAMEKGREKIVREDQGRYFSRYCCWCICSMKIPNTKYRRWKRKEERKEGQKEKVPQDEWGSLSLLSRCKNRAKKEVGDRRRRTLKREKAKKKKEKITQALATLQLTKGKKKRT